MEDEKNSPQNRLLSSALTLFAEKGYKGTAVREVVERAGVTRPVLYYYFKNKEGLFRRLVEGLFAQFTEELDAALRKGKDHRERLQIMIYRAFDRAEREPEVVQLMLHVFFAAPEQIPEFDRVALWKKRFCQVVAIMEEGRAAGDLIGKDSEILAMAFCGMMDMYVLLKTARPELRLTRELGDELVDVFLRGAAMRHQDAGRLVDVS